jgi:hypothetical protein
MGVKKGWGTFLKFLAVKTDQLNVAVYTSASTTLNVEVLYICSR